MRELSKGKGSPRGGVYYDLTKDHRTHEELKEAVLKFLPEKYKYLLKYGVDITKQPLEVAPMAHYSLGGIRINPDCQTRLKGLFAAGEVAGGVHGANRLAGNALPDTQVFGAIAGSAAAQYALEAGFTKMNEHLVQDQILKIQTYMEPKPNGVKPSQVKSELQELMWRLVGINREEKSLNAALSAVLQMKSDYLPRITVEPVKVFNLALIEALDLSKMLELAHLLIEAALIRKESRGHHFRLDFPEGDDQNWLKHIIFRKENGGHKLWTESVRA